MTEVIENALLNTVLGMGTVFCVLMFISFIIYLLGFIPKLVNMLSRKNKNVVVDAAPANVVAAAPQDADMTDDLELVAVITAAIHASMEEAGEQVSTDGLVIRSIKRRGYAR